MIYVVAEHADWSVVKIGYTHSAGERACALAAKRRLGQLQVGTWRELVCIAMFDGTQADEAQLHWRFRSARITGEWFRYTDEIVRWVRPALLMEPIAQPSPEPPGASDARLRAKRSRVQRRRRERLKREPRSFSSVDLYALARERAAV